MYSAFIRENYKQEDAILRKIRDLYALLLLQEFFSSKLRTVLVLKGLEASNLAYGITTGSNSIEFITLEKLKTPEILGEVENITKKYHNLSIIKETEKRYTYIIDLIVRDSDFEIPIKIEFTKMKYNWKRGINYDVKVLENPDWTMKTIGQVSLLTEIIRDFPDIDEFKKLNLNL